MAKDKLIQPGKAADLKSDSRSSEQSLAVYNTMSYVNNKPRIAEKNVFRQLTNNAVHAAYADDIPIEGRPLLATVTKVVKAVDETVAIAAQMPLADSDKKLLDVKNKIIVFAYVHGFEGHSLPKNKSDWINITGLGRYISFEDADVMGNLEQIEEGSTIWVTLFGDNPSPSHGGFAGNILGLFNKKPLLRELVVAEKPRIKFRPDCKSDLSYKGPTKKKLVGETDPQPNVQMPPIRKFKTMIKTGIFGNGSAQTKAHFNEALMSSEISFLYEAGPAPQAISHISSKNSFIWVGHLRNNGYLDLLDRPADLGRETIIYAPMTLNVYAPIEIKYYFHDQGGFGSAWLNGPNTNVEQSVSNTEIPGNDFREKIGPGILDMIRDKRNFILVIPEMAFSRGFGTTAVDAKRVDNMTERQPVSMGVGSPNALTLRTTIHPLAKAAVTKYLQKLSASSTETLLQKTHLRERETVTFDGSFTGGKFGNFHQEVLEVINQYIGPLAKNNVNYVSILADGLGAINLASIAKTYATSAPSIEGRDSFKATPINRIDYIENGQNVENSFSFSNSPLTTFYQEYISEKVNVGTKLEFNYITDKQQPTSGVVPGRNLFDILGYSNKFDSAIKRGSDTKGQKNFSIEPSGKQGPVIAMHTTSGNTSRTKVGYAFSLQTDFEKMLIGQVQIPDNSLINSPSFDSVPDHAGVASVRLTDGIIDGWTRKKEELLPEIERFEMDIKTQTQYEENDIVPRWTPGNPRYTPDGFKKELQTYIKNKKDFFRYEFLIEEEIKIKRYKKNRARMVQILNDKKGGVKKRLQEQKDRLKNKDIFRQYFPYVSAGSQTPASPALSADILETGLLTADLDPPALLGNEPATQNLSLMSPGTLEIGTLKVNAFSFYMEDKESDLTYVDKEYSFSSAEKRLTTAPIKVPKISEKNIWISNSNTPGIYDIILKEVAKGLFLEELAQNIQNTIDDLGPAETKPSQEGCDPQPLTLNMITNNITPIIANPQNIRMDQIACNGKRIEVVSNYQDLRKMIPWDPGPNVELDKQELGKTKKAMNSPTTLSLLEFEGEYQTKTFTYRVRGPNDTVKYKKSPPVWACIADKIREGWEAACNVSGYVPFRIFNGIKGYVDTTTGEWTPGYNIYQDGMEIGSWGLSINVDNPVAGYKGNCGQVMSVFTGMWTPKFVESYASELYDLGVLDYGTGLGDYTDNAYQGFFEKERRQAQNWKDAEDAHWTSKLEDTYDKVMKSANGSEIVPPGANPVLWVLTFCERTGMKWGNSFFLRKRYRGARTGNEFIGIEFRDSAPVSWNLEEQKRISAIYGIQDIVARINAISFPQTSYDAHMHFQYYSGPAIIPWKQLETT